MIYEAYLLTYLKQKGRNAAMNFIYQQELNHSIRVGRELINNNNITRTPEEMFIVTARKLLRQVQGKKSDSCKQKAMHGYVHKMMKASTRNIASSGCRKKS